MPRRSAEGKVTICHRTRSETNPWVLITISENGLNGHRRHGDIIPAPEGGCPEPGLAFRSSGGFGPLAVAVTPPAGGVLGAGVSGREPEGAPAESPEGGGVKGAISGFNPAESRSARPGGELPFTGIAVMLIILTGATLLATGHQIRRVT